MHRIRFSSHESYFEMELEEGEVTPNHGSSDFRVVMSAQSNGFAGASHSWVDRESLIEFLRALIKLDETRKGEASIRSMSPNELSLRVYSSSAAGHMALEGTVHHQFLGNDLQIPHTLTLGFEIDPYEVASLVKLSWVRTLAA